MSDIAVTVHTHDEDELDGCGCGREFVESEAVSDADLPAATGGVEKPATRSPAREGVA